jgi:ubiquinone/menaquinone biosynthesis C-methylase UbiE
VTIKSVIYDLLVSRRYDAELETVTEQARRRCVEMLAPRPGATALDLGCGTGLNLPNLVRAVGEGGRVIALDASRRMLDRAAARLDRHGIADSVTLVHGDARRVDELVAEELGGAPLEALLITLFMSVVPAWREVYARAFSLLAPGGRCAMMDTYWPEPPLRLWLMSWSYAADPKRPGFELLRESCEDFVLEHFPPDVEHGFYLASGTRRGR